ncbi:hypothetical protein [Taklimakanibacter deserti]|uniref:hypothetical protein n=1 Tax=Taklimakanibacter deserti TaxID=2267839 RepID=UPI0013C538FE
MVTYRFRGQHSAVPAILTEKGHRTSDPPKRGRQPRSERAEPSAEDPHTVPSPLFIASVPPVRPPDLASVPSSLFPSRQGGITVLRHKIMDSGVIDALIDFVEGRRDLSPEQVATGIALARKIVPDLATAASPAENDESAENASPEFEIHVVDPKA